MRKFLSKITEEEKNIGLSLISLRATYSTLLNISRYPMDKTKIQAEIDECENKINDFWYNITTKYRLPLYIDKPMGIDTENCAVYVEI